MLERDEAIKVLRLGGYLYRARRPSRLTLAHSSPPSLPTLGPAARLSGYRGRLGHARLVRPTAHPLHPPPPVMVGCLVPTSDISNILELTPSFSVTTKADTMRAMLITSYPYRRHCDAGPGGLVGWHHTLAVGQDLIG